MTLKVDRIEVGSGAPRIDNVPDLFTGKNDGTLTAGKSVRISGTALKIGGTGSGIFLVPVVDGGELDIDESNWISVQRMVTNKPGSLEFWLPPEVSPGSWSIALRTSFLSTKTERNNAVSVFSRTVQVIAE